jgi:hypothetical protein
MVSESDEEIRQAGRAQDRHARAHLTDGAHELGLVRVFARVGSHGVSVLMSARQNVASG